MILPLILMQTIMYQGNAKFKNYIGRSSHHLACVRISIIKETRAGEAVWWAGGEDNLPIDGEM